MLQGCQMALTLLFANVAVGRNSHIQLLFNIQYWLFIERSHCLSKNKMASCGSADWTLAQKLTLQSLTGSLQGRISTQGDTFSHYREWVCSVGQCQAFWSAAAEFRGLTFGLALIFRSLNFRFYVGRSPNRLNILVNLVNNEKALTSVDWHSN